MTHIEHDRTADEIHPIDIVESLAELNAWEFDRVGDNQIAMTVEGAWRTYALSLIWSGSDEVLRLICTFELSPPASREGELLRLIDMANDRVWTGAFTTWREKSMIVFRYGLMLGGGALPSSDQIGQMLESALLACERFYPAFQLVSFAGKRAEEALGIAIVEAYGRA